ncbi:PfkB family carbohydrate kinase [Parapedobacter sp. 10938]|uniref:PfkB family carbohydrate kinase n=1 Tax=Parapedobacter flavus TaxID=3110225 RepID=UPI002DBEE8A3|nr:PfkB family carbohydrate kinase [Parapedobacter sp. 10938]MEC3878123.1 PfkB family carbohydrate kinase [Parapedobacter sp. 10938]
MKKNNRIFCFGEVLWDEVNGEDVPGGAPLNVAYHIGKDDRFEVHLVSCIGDDAAGACMLSLIDGWSIDRQFVQSTADYPTGRVVANVSDRNKVSYDILQPVAWDYINEDSALSDCLHEDDCLVFGSLSCRNMKSRQTLFTLLSQKCFRIFDINLRGNYYDEETLSVLLENTDLLKISDEELVMVTRLFQPTMTTATEKEQLRTLMSRFNIGAAIVTRGADGASYYTTEGHWDVPGVRVAVVDTIGCGDAFLAAFLRYRLTGTSLETTLNNAMLTGAFIARQKGGCPPYTLADLETFISEKSTGEFGRFSAH